MRSSGSRGGWFRGMCGCAMASMAVLASASVPAAASAASPVLEFVPSGAGFPIEFEADGGDVTAVLEGFSSVVHCSGSHGAGQITGPRTALSQYVFTGCEAEGGSDAGHPCQSASASSEEIVSEEIEAELVYVDQAKHEVGMLLNPGEGVYMDFECGGEEVKARGRFLSPVGPTNRVDTSFTASLSRQGATQIPSEYENALGEKREAIPTGERGSNPPTPTGVELSFTIETGAPLEIKAITAAEIEARQHEDEAAASAAAQKRQEEEAAVAAAARRLRKAETRLRRVRHRLRAFALKRCRRSHSKRKRVRCEKRVKKKYDRRRGKRAMRGARR